MKSSYVNLHNHSHYSLLEGLSKIKQMVARAKKHGMSSLALTDHGNLYGAIEFYKACRKEDINPIIGLDAYYAPGSRHDKNSRVDELNYHLVLLAKNNTGYKNLISLVSRSYLEGFSQKPRIDEEILREHSEGLICLSGDFRSEIFDALKENDEGRAVAAVKRFQDIFGKENFYLELMPHANLDGGQDVWDRMIEFSKKHGLPLVAGTGTYYLDPDDKEAHNTLLAIQGTGTRTHFLAMRSSDFSFYEPSKMDEIYKNVPEALENTNKIADQINIEIQLGEWVFPNYEIPKNTTYEEELRKLTYAGLEKRGKEKTKEVEDRIEFELKVINDKGFAGYFLIVADFLRYAHENGIYTNIRGSVAGSMVSYLVGITDLDPLEYKLVFERFLNPDRPSAPDIDMDFADNRRDEVIDYAREKYGKEKVAQIGTFGKMLARGVVRDVARAMGHPYGFGDKIAKLIPFGSQGFPMTIERALKEEPDFKKLYDTDTDVQELIDLAKKIEGCARHVGVHAAGVVISPTELTDFTPVQFDPKGGKLISQYDMYSVEDAGLIKFDFLGIKNLSILADAVRRVKKIRGIDVDIQNVDTSDKKTYELLTRGETAGTFQLNGAGMTRFLKELKPTTIHDINAMVALYRPGPMEFIPEYIKRKQNPENAKAPHPLMEEDLKFSFGLLIYQEDVMMTAIKLAGYSWLDADKFRKAMGKKIPELMMEQEEKFKTGCVANGIKKELAEDLWERIKPFASYAFNKAHSASYGRVAYQTAYMKANYPAEYMTSLLTADAGDVDKISELVTECKRMGFDVLPPDVNESYHDFTVVVEENGEATNKIRFGLSSIKNFGEEIGRVIIEEREKNGPYKNYTNFLDRVLHRNLNKKSLESLIKCGAMDSLEGRGVLLANLDEALAYNRDKQKEGGEQNSLFGLMDNKESVPVFHLKPAAKIEQSEKLKWEKDLLGLYVSGHPLDKFKDKFDNQKENIKDLLHKKDGESVVVAGIFDDVKVIMTKKGKKMAFCKVSDFAGSIEVVVFPDTYEKFIDFLEPERCVAVRGNISHRNGEVSVIMDVIKPLD